MHGEVTHVVMTALVQPVSGNERVTMCLLVGAYRCIEHPLRQVLYRLLERVRVHVSIGQIYTHLLGNVVEALGGNSADEAQSVCKRGDIHKDARINATHVVVERRRCQVVLEVMLLQSPCIELIASPYGIFKPGV